MSRNTPVLKTARFLRRNMTDTEKILWRALRSRKQNNTKFRRQVPFALGEYHFVADFYCPEKKLIIEIDGSIHRENDIIEYDRFREDIFKIGQYQILRFSNEQILNSIAKVLDKIKIALTSPGLRPPSPN
ncbi:MAG: endonuclease domain-containing protein [Candidatus Latescibacter sp.]|nr:endonuclease domain-containing protein [Candidatus Latescibacter sp.]